MAVFLKLVEMDLKVCLQYKLGFFITVFVQPFEILVIHLLFKGLYAYNQTQLVQGYSLNEMIWYFIVVRFVFIFIWNWTCVDMSDKIISGKLTLDLVRPVSVMKLELANALGDRIMGVLLEFIPSMLLLSLLYPPKFLIAYSMLRFFIVIIGSFLLYFMISFFISLFAYPIKNSTTIIIVQNFIIPAIGGINFPLEFLPSGVNRVLDFLPFKYIFYWPIQFFLNRPATREPFFVFRIFLIQMLFTLVFYLLSKLFYNHIAKEYCATGS